MINILDFKHMNALDYLDLQPDDYFRLALTDPPYIISKKTGFMDVGKKGNKGFKMETDYGEWDKIPLLDHIKLLYDVTKKLYNKLLPGGVLIMFYDYWKLGILKRILEKNNFKMFKILEWQKTNPVPVNSQNFYLSGVRELAIACVKGGKPKFKTQYHNGIFQFPIAQLKGDQKRIHPNEKSMPLAAKLIEIHTDTNESIIDPFAGSGAFLLAALKMGRKAHGCEKDIDYYNKANTRLQEYIKITEGILKWE